MDANEMYGTFMLELNKQVFSDTYEAKEEQESFSFHEEADSDEIPPSLLSYFEASKSRAAACEKLILEELEDFKASHHTEDLMNLPFELDKDMMKRNEQVISDPENEENNTSTDTRLLPAPTETEALFTHNVLVCPNNEDEYTESQKRFTLVYEAEQEKQHCEEMKKEEERRQKERDFQKELQKIMEAEKLHQKEVELMGKRAQERLEQELLLQQELISNLQRRVEEERRIREEEQKRMKDEEDKRRREEAERKRMEEEMSRKKEEERQIEEMKLKQEEERKHKEEEKRRRREEKRKRDAERKKLEDEMRMMEEEERKKKEEEERITKEEKKRKREEERKKIEEARKKMEKEKKAMEEEMSRKKEEERKKIEEVRITLEIEERKKQEEVRKQKEEEEALKKMHEEMRKRDEREHGNLDEEIKLEERKNKEENDRKRSDDEEEEARKREKERKPMKEKEVKEVVRKREGENKKMKEDPRPMEEDEKRKREHDRKTKEEEWRTRQKEEMRHEGEECYRKSEEEIKLKEDKEDYKKYDVNNRKVEHESKTKDEEKKQDEEDKKLAKEEMRKEEEERKRVEVEKELKEEEVGENKTEVNKNTEEEIRLKEKEESKKRVVQGREEEGRRADELQKNRENNYTNIDETENSLASQLEDSTTWTSSRPGPLLSECTSSPTSTEPIQHDPEENISQTSTDKTVYCETEAAGSSTVLCVILPGWLPESTENKRLAWMKDCISWSKLSLQNRRKQKGCVRSRRGLRGAAGAGSLPPLCPDAVLQSTGWKSLQEVTTVTLEDLPGCSLSTLTQCTQLRSLTLRRCSLRSLEGISHLPQLCYIDVQENDISFIDCENMSSLRVLQLGHNKLTSIHGLSGAENLDFLDLSHNAITRIAGLECMRRLQRLSVDHNQLISTKGLRDVYTLLHLNCSHNHLARVEGLENSALLSTLDLRANSLTEPPSLNNQVLLRELHLDDNSISSLHGLAACWLPLMQHLSVAQNRITQLPSMSDSVSLVNLDLRFNCLSELQTVCESLEGCLFLREVHLTGNPLQQESGWRSTLHTAVPGLRAINGLETDSFLTLPADQQVSLASGSFLKFCQAQLQQICDLQQQHSRELSNTSSSLGAVKTSCRHFTEALQLAKDQRFAHEYGDTTVADKHRAAGQTAPEETLDMDSTNAEMHEMESTGKVSPVGPNRDRCSCWTFEEKSAAENCHDILNHVTTGPKTGPTVSKAKSGSVHSSAAKRTAFSSSLEITSVSYHEDLDRQNTAAVVIQRLWRKYRQKCGNISSFSTAEKGGGRGGDGGKPESGPSYINGSVVGQDYAATVIQAFWRGVSLRRRLASALAAVTCPDIGEDDTFEEVDVDEFVFDEAVLEKQWTLSLSEDSPHRRYPVCEQPLSLKPAGHFPELSQYTLPPPPVWRPKQAWAPGEQVDSAGQRVSPESSNRCKSPASTSVRSGLSERSEKIVEEWGFTNSRTAFLMLKRAQKMKSAAQRQKKRRDPSVCLALFRNSSSQLAPVEAPNRPTRHNRNDRKVGEAELGLQQAEKVERVRQERARQWLHTQAAPPDGDPQSVRFLPEISPDVLNGGRVQLVADPGYTERLHHASGLWANNSSAAQASCKESNYPRRNSLGHARKEVPSPQQVASAPLKKERISHRDNPVQLSAGWGGGKKRDKVYK